MTTTTSKLWTPTPDVFRVSQTPDLEAILHDLINQMNRKALEARSYWCGYCNLYHKDYGHEEHPTDHGFLLGPVAALVDRRGFPIRQEYLDGPSGMTDGCEIILDFDQSAGSKAHVLLHELTHAVASFYPGMRGYDPSEEGTRREEVLAESTAYVTATALGLHTPFSAFYLAGYEATQRDFDMKRGLILRTAESFVGELGALMRQEARVAA